MGTIIAAPTSCKVLAVIRFLHAEGQSTAEINRRLCRVYSDNVMSQTLNKLGRSIQNKWRGMLTKGVVLLHDNAQPPHHVSHKCFNQALQLGDFQPPSL